MKRFAFFIILLIISAFLSANIVQAHDVESSDAWILFNSEDILVPNPTPETLTLKTSQHIVKKRFEVNENINIKVNLQSVKLDPDIHVVSWRISNGQELTGSEVNIAFENSGNYFFTLKAQENGKISLLEEFIVTVGRMPAKPIIEVNNKVTFRKAMIDLKAENVFSIINSSDDYNYIWDFPDGTSSNTAVATKTFETLETPAYITLRAIDKNNENAYTDTYIRLTIASEYSFDVEEDLVMEDLDNEVKGEIITVVMIGVVVVFGSIYYLGRVFRRSLS